MADIIGDFYLKNPKFGNVVRVGTNGGKTMKSASQDGVRSGSSLGDGSFKESDDAILETPTTGEELISQHTVLVNG